MNNIELNEAAEKHGNLSGYNMNDEIGSYHWFHTLMAQVLHIGEYQMTHDRIHFNETLQKDWGKQLYNIAKDMMHWYAQFKAEQKQLPDEEIEKLAEKEYPLPPIKGWQPYFDVWKNNREVFIKGFKYALQTNVGFSEDDIKVHKQSE